MNHLTLSAAVCAVALMAACGKQETAAPAPAPAPAAAPSPAPAPAPAAAPAPATAPVAASADENAAGKATFNKTCAVCHAAGVAGAPKPGDKADWAPRLAQGMDVLNDHAIKGFTGAKGAMPPKGGAANLSDDEVKAAVKYMADASR